MIFQSGTVSTEKCGMVRPKSPDSIIPQLSDYEIINLFLDNDLPGIESSEKITNCFQNVVNYSMLIYPDHKDFNEFMVKNVNG